ncbi:MAG: hypothetical protein ABGZ35_19480, partial [Planctomycetaceae bacterium]
SGSLPQRQSASTDTTPHSKLNAVWDCTRGCLGMILAAAVFIPLVLLYAKDYPWLVFAWPFFGMAMVVAAIKLGLVIQRRISG